jgi:hypothetical protein
MYTADETSQVPDRDNSSRGRYNAVRRGTPPDGGAFASAFCVFMGLLCLLCGGWLTLSLLANNHIGMAIAAFLVGMPAGIGLVGWQGPRAFLPFILRTPRAAVSADEVERGERFEFRYWQQVTWGLTADITVSLILREMVERPIGEGDVALFAGAEHLIESHTTRGVTARTGEALRTGHSFVLPADGGSGVASRHARELIWLMKVRVRLQNGMDIWEEFELPYPTGLERGRFGLSSQPEGCRVVVQRYPGWIYGQSTPDALLDVAPHLHRVIRFPLLVLEGQTRDAAERACRRLEADGAVVQLWDGDQVVTRQQTHTMPLPAESAPISDRALPIPAGLGAAGGELLIELGRSEAADREQGVSRRCR